MPTINFPNSPSVNQTYAIGNRTWKYNGAGWELVPLTAGFTGSQGDIGYTGSRGDTGFVGSEGNLDVTTSATPPSTPQYGDIWIDENSGIQYFWYNDGNSDQWVEFANQGIVGFTGSRGTTGFTGSAGTNGFTGSQGNTGLGFNIAKIYASVAALTADTSPSGIVAGEFAVVETGNVNDSENSRLYLWTGSAYSFVSDLSGTLGFTGSAGTNGYTGSAGTNGYTGSQGDIGYTGSASTVVGYTGSQGNIGYTGSSATNITTADLAAGVLDIDISSVAGTDTTLPSAKAVKTYVDNQVASVGGGTSWQAVKTSAFNAAAGEGYFVNTTSAAITATLPASPTLGDEVVFVDYAGTFDTNNLTVARNGNPIQGSATDLTASTERAGFTLVFVNATQGWLLKDK